MAKRHGLIEARRQFRLRAHRTPLSVAKRHGLIEAQVIQEIEVEASSCYPWQNATASLKLVFMIGSFRFVFALSVAKRHGLIEAHRPCRLRPSYRSWLSVAKRHGLIEA